MSADPGRPAARVYTATTSADPLPPAHFMTPIVPARRSDGVRLGQHLPNRLLLDGVRGGAQRGAGIRIIRALYLDPLVR